MTDKPLVSVVIATYNMARFLPLALRSALDQSYENMEVLVIDDGSQDDTQAAMAPFRGDHRVRYIFQQNGGQASAKNHGIRQAQGEYVAFLDADDLWTPDKLERQMPLFLRSPAVGIVYSRVACIDEAGRELRIEGYDLFRGRVSGPLLISNFIGFGTSVVRKECFDRLGSFDESIGMGIDYDLWLRFSTQYEFDYVDRPLLRYREWPGQMSRNWRVRYLNGIAIMKNFLRNFPDVVDQRTVNEAWAHTYTGFGYCARESRRTEALGLYLRALRFRPAYVPAWKGIAATLLGR
jgi:glycosyltransferase involved in cell wall biosynthesis